MSTEQEKSNYNVSIQPSMTQKHNNIVQLRKEILPVVPIPDDFLRIPTVAPRSSSFTYEVTLQKDSVAGLGMSIRDTANGLVTVTNLNFRNSPARLAGEFSSIVVLGYIYVSFISSALGYHSLINVSCLVSNV